MISGGTGESARGARSDGPERLRVEELAGPRFGPVSLEVHGGEIVGLYGVLGSGRSSLLETLAGRYGRRARNDRRGRAARRPALPGSALRAGVALVPSDRLRQALWDTRSAADNLLLPSYAGSHGAACAGSPASAGVFGDIARRVGLQPMSPGQKGAAFSGGNQQKLVLGRWLAQADRLAVLLLDEPTQGVDVGARRQIYDTCDELAASGMAVLFASSEAEEVARLAHRALILDRGRIIADLAGEEITESALMHRAHQFTGVTADEPDPPSVPEKDS